MDTFTTKDLTSLNDPGAAMHCLSLYMPTHVVGPSALEDQVRLKNLADRGEELLVEHGLRRPEAREVVDRVRMLPLDGTFWRQRSRGLAVFASPTQFRTYRLPESFSEVVVVNRRYHLKPLVSLLTGDVAFYVLAVSQKRIRLFSGSRFALREVSVRGLPTSLEESLNYDTPDRGAQVHSGGKFAGGGRKQSAVFHGQGGEPETAKDELGAFLRLVDRAIQPVLVESSAPLVLACVEQMGAMFRAITSCPRVLDTMITGNPDHATEHELHARTWPIVEASLAKPREEALAKFRRLAGTGKTSDDLRVILPAATEGRIETLFVDANAYQWGRSDRANRHIELCEQHTPGDDDLLDLATVQVLETRGTVYSLPKTLLPCAGPIAATFRY